MIAHEVHSPSIELNLVWNEKLFLVQKASQLNPFDSEWFHWIDAGIAEYRNTPPPDTSFPNKHKIRILSKDRITCSWSQPYYKQYVTPKSYYHCIAGTSYILHKNMINSFCTLYYEYMDRFVNTENIWTDQVILTHMFHERPELFYMIGTGYGAVTKCLF